MTEIVAVGAGRMGRGIAQVFAYAGHPVTLLDLKDRDPAARTALFDGARGEIRENLEFLAAEGVFDAGLVPAIMDRIRTAGAAEARSVLATAEVIFEGVPETLDAKRDALRQVGEHARPDAIIASTTSTIVVETLADLVPNPERFLNAHWLNPAFLIPLVEVSPGERTADAVTDQLVALLESVGKVPVKCKASPGFIVPRIQALAMNEAARMVEEGVATAEDIDKAIRVGFGPRFATMGMLEFIDWGGGDILYHASNYLTDALKSDRFAAPDVVVNNMKTGNIGMGAGKGFYDFDAMDVSAYRQATLSRFVALIRHMNLLHDPKMITDIKTNDVAG